MNADIYNDLDTLDNQFETIKQENEQLKKTVEKLKQTAIKFSVEIEDLKRINGNLELNISALFKTAKAELERKNKQIAELRKELDNILFKRGAKGKIPPKSKNESQESEINKQYEKAQNDIKIKNRIIQSLNRELGNVRKELEERTNSTKRTSSQNDEDYEPNSKAKRLKLDREAIVENEEDYKNYKNRYDQRENGFHCSRSESPGFRKQSYKKSRYVDLRSQIELKRINYRRRSCSKSRENYKFNKNDKTNYRNSQYYGKYDEHNSVQYDPDFDYQKSSDRKQKYRYDQSEQDSGVFNSQETTFEPVQSETSGTMNVKNKNIDFQQNQKSWRDNVEEFMKNPLETHIYQPNISVYESRSYNSLENSCINDDNRTNSTNKIGTSEEVANFDNSEKNHEMREVNRDNAIEFTVDDHGVDEMKKQDSNNMNTTDNASKSNHFEISGNKTENLVSNKEITKAEKRKLEIEKLAKNLERLTTDIEKLKSGKRIPEKLNKVDSEVPDLFFGKSKKAVSSEPEKSNEIDESVSDKEIIKSEKRKFEMTKPDKNLEKSTPDIEKSKYEKPVSDKLNEVDSKIPDTSENPFLGNRKKAVSSKPEKSNETGKPVSHKELTKSKKRKFETTTPEKNLEKSTPDIEKSKYEKPVSNKLNEVDSEIPDTPENLFFDNTKMVSSKPEKSNKTKKPVSDKELTKSEKRKIEITRPEKNLEKSTLDIEMFKSEKPISDKVNKVDSEITDVPENVFIETKKTVSSKPEKSNKTEKRVSDEEIVKSEKLKFEITKPEENLESSLGKEKSKSAKPISDKLNIPEQPEESISNKSEKSISVESGKSVSGTSKKSDSSKQKKCVSSKPKKLISANKNEIEKAVADETEKLVSDKTKSDSDGTKKSVSSKSEKSVSRKVQKSKKPAKLALKKLDIIKETDPLTESKSVQQTSSETSTTEKTNEQEISESKTDKIFQHKLLKEEKQFSELTGSNKEILPKVQPTISTNVQCSEIVDANISQVFSAKNVKSTEIPENSFSSEIERLEKHLCEQTDSNKIISPKAQPSTCTDVQRAEKVDANISHLFSVENVKNADILENSISTGIKRLGKDYNNMPSFPEVEALVQSLFEPKASSLANNPCISSLETSKIDTNIVSTSEKVEQLVNMETNSSDNKVSNVESNQQQSGPPATQQSQQRAPPIRGRRRRIIVSIT